jgi:maleate cis-trans isomerase
MAGDWRGTIGVVKPGVGTPSLVEFIRLLPDGINVIPTFAEIREHSVGGFHDALESYREKIAWLAQLGICDLIHPEGAPPFMVRGRTAERELIEEWEATYGVPVFTSSMIQVEALKAMRAERFLGFTFYEGALPDSFTSYFTEAGLDVAGMETLPPRSRDWRHPSAEDLYFHMKTAFRKYSDVQGIYLHGSSSWRLMDVGALERDLGVPVLHPIAIRIWYVLKQLGIREPRPGIGRLLETLP